MGTLEIFLVVFGILLIAISYIFSEHLLSVDQGDGEDANVTKVTREIVKKEVEAEVANVIDEKIEQAEVKLDKITTEKIMALGNYSDDVNTKITKNHDEVMFLYDMLSDKEKTIKNTIRDVEALKLSVNARNKTNEENSSFLQDESKEKKQKTNKNIGNKSDRNTTINLSRIEDELNSLSGLSTVKKSGNINRSGNSNKLGNINESNNISKSRKLSETSNVNEENVAREAKKTNASNISNTAKRMNEQLEEISTLGNETTNNNKAILDLYNNGKTNIEIAKTLGLGMGEVKLVIDLFNSRKQ